MSDNSGKDLLPMLLPMALAFVLHLGFIFKLLFIIPVIYYVGHFLGQARTRTEYVSPQKPQNSEYNEAMFGYSHPVVMPYAFYYLEGLMMYLYSFLLFFAPGISRYFSNWGSVYLGMGALKAGPRTYSSPANSSQSHASRTQARPSQKPPIPKKLPIPNVKDTRASSGSGQLFPRPEKKARPVVDEAKETQRAIERNLLTQIENNDRELHRIKDNSEAILENIFGGSKLSIARFTAGLDEAIAMSQNNLEQARLYVKIGHNMDILRKYYERSVQINKKAADLLDSLVTHQQAENDDDFEEMTRRLDELQDSIKYYELH